MQGRFLSLWNRFGPRIVISKGLFPSLPTQGFWWEPGAEGSFSFMMDVLATWVVTWSVPSLRPAQTKLHLSVRNHCLPEFCPLVGVLLFEHFLAVKLATPRRGLSSCPWGFPWTIDPGSALRVKQRGALSGKGRGVVGSDRVWAPSTGRLGMGRARGHSARRSARPATSF